MSSYTVGSVADLIRQSLGVKIKKEKKNNEIAYQEENLSNKSSYDENFVKKLFFEEKSIIDNEIKSKKRKNTVTESEPQLNTSKRLKKNALVDDKFKNNPTPLSKKFSQVLNDKLGESEENIPDFDHVPSDSEGEDEKGGEFVSTSKIFDSKLKKPVINSEKKFNRTENNTEHTVFVGNLPIKYDKFKVCKLFSKYGKIVNARIRCVPIADINMSKKVAAIKKQFNPNRNSLVAYVKYENKESANAALVANGMVVDGHHLRVDMAEESKERDNNKAVFVGGLPFDIQDDELWKFFENCGKINNVRVIRDSQTSMGKGFGYVNFDSTTSVELALQLDGHELKKRVINVKRCMNALGKKGKMNVAFDKKKSKEMAEKLLAKKLQRKKIKAEKSQRKLENKSKFSNEFQGNKANMKKKKKKKLSKMALQKRKVIKILGS